MRMVQTNPPGKPCQTDGSKKRTVLLCLLLALITGVVYWPVATQGFTNYDDPAYVSGNPHIQGGLTWEGVRWAFASFHAGNWHPLTWLSHMLDCQLYGLRAGGHHVTNLLFHVVNSLLLFGLLQRLTRDGWRVRSGAGTLVTPCWPSFFVAALFALHPLHVESVAWVAERKDVLSTFFFLLTMMAYVRYVTSDGWQVARGMREGAGHLESRTSDTQHPASSIQHPASSIQHPSARRLWYLSTLLLFALGLMSKPMLVTVPFVLLLLDFWPLGRLRKPERRMQNEECRRQKAEGDSSSFILHPSSFILLEKLPFLALSAVSCVVTFLIQRGAGAVSSLDALPLGFRVSNALISYVRYAVKMVWPTNLAVFYPAPPEWPLAWVAGAALFLAGITVLALRLARKAPWFAFGWFWYLGTLVPVIGIVQVGQQAIADRYSYIPLIGLFVVVAWTGAEVGARWPKSRVWLGAGATAALAVCGTLTWQQAGYWRDSASLFRHALAVTRDNYVAHNNLGAVLLNEGDRAAAEGHFAEAVRLKPNYADALGSLGLCREKQGRLEEARELYERSLKVRPSATVHYDLALLLAEQGNLGEARAQYEAALQLKPEFVEAWYNLGALESKQGRPADAARDFSAALRIDPSHVGSHLGLGALLAGEKKFEEAMAHFKAVLRTAPENADAHFNLAAALNAKGDYAGAAVEFAVVCRLHPEDAEARANLGVALLYQGRTAEAAEQFQEVLRRAQPDARIHHYLGLALDSQGQAEEAVAHYREAVRLSPATPLYLNDLAWSLATNPKPELREGAEAVRLAERACELSGGKEARCWGTLDAAYAEAGRFADALATADKTRALALAAGQPAIARQAEERMALYRAGKPYRNTAPASTPRP